MKDIQVTSALMPEILFEDNHLIAVNKPAGILVQGDASGRVHLMDIVKSYLRLKYHKPGNVFLGLVHRLDRQVSGVVLFAKTSKAASRLSAQFREREVEKIYLAAVGAGPGHADAPSGFTTLTQHISSEDGVPELHENESPGSRPARLEYSIVARNDAWALLVVRLHTGRKHQIRIQLASRGMPVIGDALYGSPEPAGGDALLLHAHTLIFAHPTTRAPVTITATVPERFSAYIVINPSVAESLSRIIGDISRSRPA